jgi:hypothetical protein
MPRDVDSPWLTSSWASLLEVICVHELRYRIAQAGFRTQTVMLVITLLKADLYQGHWQVEWSLVSVDDGAYDVVVAAVCFPVLAEPGDAADISHVAVGHKDIAGVDARCHPLRDGDIILGCLAPVDEFAHPTQGGFGEAPSIELARSSADTCHSVVMLLKETALWISSCR